MDDQPLFKSAHAALVFAFNFAGQSHDRPMMNRMAAPGIGTGKGLSKLDGAGQAGMIKAELERIGKLGKALIIARIMPTMETCDCKSPCCSGRRMNKEWAAAVGLIADHARRAALAGCVCNGSLRLEYVRRYFAARDKRIGLEEISKRHAVNAKTVSAHYGKVAALLGGSKGKDQPPGIEQLAWNAIEDQLREVGIVG